MHRTMHKKLNKVRGPFSIFVNFILTSGDSKLQV